MPTGPTFSSQQRDSARGHGNVTCQVTGIYGQELIWDIHSVTDGETWLLAGFLPTSCTEEAGLESTKWKGKHQGVRQYRLKSNIQPRSVVSVSPIS